MQLDDLGLEAKRDVAAVAAEQQDRDDAEHHRGQRRERAAAVATRFRSARAIVQHRLAAGPRPPGRGRAARCGRRGCERHRRRVAMTCASCEEKTNGDALVALHRAHQRDDRGARAAVEIRGRLVREDERGRRRERARDRDPLALSARELGGAVPGLRRRCRRPRAGDRRGGAARVPACARAAAGTRRSPRPSARAAG